MRTSEDDPQDWFLLAADRLRIADLARQHEGVTFSGVELLQEAGKEQRAKRKARALSP